MAPKVCLIYLIFCIVVVRIPNLKEVLADEKPDLYTPIDDVIRLNSTTFGPTLFSESKNVTYMVQFYNTFCGHCQMFAPIYKNLASRVKNWTSVVRIAGVDCSKDENTITCSENNIMGYPTLYIYPPNPKKDDPQDAPLNLRNLQIEWTVDDIEEAIIDFLGNLSSTQHEYPPVVDALQPIQKTRLQDIQRIYSPKNDHDEAVNDRHSLQDLMFIIESDKSYLGRKLIVEYYRISSRLELRRILLTNKTLLESLLSERDLEKFERDQPILVRVNSLDEGRKATVLVRGEIEHILPTSDESERQDFVHNRFKMFFEHYYFVELKESGFTDATQDSTVKKGAKTSHNTNPNDEELGIQYLVNNDPTGSTKIFAIDLIKSISYMITHEILIKGDLKPKEFETVRNLLTILNKYLPLERWDGSLSEMIVDLRTRLDKNRAIYEKNGVKAQEMRDLLELSGADAIRLKYSRENWVSCFKSERHHKGYTCSLWLLFHSLTVGEYSKSAPVRVRPTMVLFTMRDYIIKFLGCSVCSSNFEKETENLDANLVYRNSSVLWLWNTHNLVNQRLNNEKQNDNKSLNEVIFPAPSRCPHCFKTQVSEIGVDGKTYADIEWNMQHVFEFITELYKPDKIATPIELSSLLSKVKDKMKYDVINADHSGQRLVSTDMNRSVDQWNIQSIFTTGDMSICFFLYLSCIMIVALVCVALNPKWTRFKSK